MISAAGSGISLDGTYNIVSNTGSIFGVDKGVINYGLRFNLSNTGTITGDTGVEIDGQVGNPDSVVLMGTVQNSGTITGNVLGVRALSESLTLTNFGIISGGSYGVIVTGGVGVQGIIVNFGTISGDAANVTGSSVFTAGGDDSLVNYGTLIGKVEMTGGADFFKNGGTLSGGVDLGTGNDIYKAVGNGSVSGAILGGAGDDTLKGGGFDDTMDGGAGVDILKGRGGNDMLTDTSGNDRF